MPVHLAQLPTHPGWTTCSRRPILTCTTIRVCTPSQQPRSLLRPIMAKSREGVLELKVDQPQGTPQFRRMLVVPC